MKLKPDWVAIRRDWDQRIDSGDVMTRSGLPNVSDMARQYGIARNTLLDRIKRYKWDEKASRGYLDTGTKVRDVENLASKSVILGYLEESGLFNHAAAKAGITYATLKNWRDKDPEFNTQCFQALSRRADKHLTAMNNAAETDWKAAERLLAINPVTKEDFAKTENAGGGTINVQINIPRPGDTDQRYSESITINQNGDPETDNYSGD